MLSLELWHKRYRQQAEWTFSARQRAYQLSKLGSATAILDVGSGTGVLEEELASLSEVCVTCVDLSLDNLFFHQKKNKASLVNADGQHLPFRKNTFDIALCHYLLLWLSNPLAVLREMTRVIHPGGYVIALAEPDYAHRIEYPQELQMCSNMQRMALIEQGANPDIGPSLGQLFFSAGLQVIEIGLTGGEWHRSEPTEDTQLEFLVARADIGTLATPDELARWRELSNLSSMQGRRISFLPVFYAVGKLIP